MKSVIQFYNSDSSIKKMHLLKGMEIKQITQLIVKSQFVTFLVLAILLLLITNCEKPVRDNPWDEKAKISPEVWAPQKLQIEDVTITEKKLTWTYGEQNIEGFKIDRKKGEDPWLVDYKTLPKETRNWSDTEIIPNPSLTYEYTVYAFAGSNGSAVQSVSASAAIAAPTNLQTEKLTDKRYKLIWTDNSTGEQGFKIDRKIDENTWTTAFGMVAANQTSFTDTNVFRAINVEYRVYGFYENYESSKVTTNVNVELTAPSDLQISRNSITSLTLSWKDNSNGEEGFKIDRIVNEGYWTEEYATINSGTQFTDNGLDLNNNTYWYRVYAYYNQFESLKIGNNISNCNPFTDNRDNNEYATVPIGSQCWMKENLAWLPNVSPSSNGSQTSLYYYVYDYGGTSVSTAKTTNTYQTYGVLYNWPASLTACPEGWHLPSDAEWTVLTDYLDDESVAGGKMKETGTTHWLSPNTGATNSSGFTGLPGGFRHPNGTFQYIGDYGYWWSSTQTSTAGSWGRNLYYNDAIVDHRYSNYKESGFSVRCLRDSTK